MATVVRDFPHSVRVIENTWITLSDGTSLAAKIWLPDDADTDPVPAVLEFLPYRKRDGTAARDQLLFPYLAGHGYAPARSFWRNAWRHLLPRIVSHEGGRRFDKARRSAIR